MMCCAVFGLQVKYLPVLEKDTVLRLEMFDYDAVNVTSFAGLKNMASLEVSTVLFHTTQGMLLVWVLTCICNTCNVLGINLVYWLTTAHFTPLCSVGCSIARTVCHKLQDVSACTFHTATLATCWTA